MPVGVPLNLTRADLHIAVGGRRRDRERADTARLRLVDGEPMAIEYLYVPAEFVPGLRPADMESGDFCSARVPAARPYGVTVPCPPVPVTA